MQSIVYSPAIAAPIIARHGTERQKKDWPPGLANGKSIFSFAITEPDPGNSSHRLTTSAVKRDGAYYINGQ